MQSRINTRSYFPKLNKLIATFLVEEKGRLSKHKVASLGAFLGSASILSLLPELQAGHTNYFSGSWSSGIITGKHGHHVSHASHSSHGSHASHGSHSSHASHSSHLSHASHSSHLSHASHVTHSTHAAHATHYNWPCGAPCTAGYCI